MAFCSETQLLILLLLGAFYLGKCTAEPTESQDNSSFNISGFFHKLLPDFGSAEENTTIEEVTEEVSETELKEETEEVVEEEPEPTETVTQPKVITSYRFVSVSATNFQTDWHGTWGEITNFDFTIRNNEDGIIKPPKDLRSLV